MNRKNDVCYDKKTIGKEGYLVTLYRYTNNNADEQTIVMRFDPNKVDGHAVEVRNEHPNGHENNCK